ncbi:MAG: ComEC/Rec2 family competence protein, partial [Candidatus Stahlbacteria bacterium]|nr:ComEC/Rec2 family competence protein [Candidatus Stahlbacteria bacterium]
PNSFDYGSWLKQEDIYVQMNVWQPEDIRVIGNKICNPMFSKIALPIKRHIHNTIDKYLGWIQGAFLKSIVIGEHGILPRQIMDAFQNTGVIHLIAVSGTQVAIIAVIIFTTLSLFRLPLLSKQLITFAFLIIYAFITDLCPPIVRSTIMSGFAMLALSMERESDIFNIMGGAGLFILLLNPQSLFDVGFLLSFGGVFFGVYLYSKLYPLIFREPNLQKATGVKKFLLQFYHSITQLFTFSFCAQLGVTPIVAYHFFKLPIISIMANLFVIPLTGICISLTFIMSLANLLPWHLPVQLFASATWAVSTFTLKIVEWLDKVPYAYIWVGKPSILIIVFYYLLLLSAVNLTISRIARRVFVYGILLFSNLLLWSKVYEITHPQLKITYLDVSHADCTLIELPDKRKILIDAGLWRKNWDAGANIISPFLRSKGIAKIDILIATNPKYYRIGGMWYIIEHFKVKEFVCPAISHRSITYYNLLNLLSRNKIECKFINAENISLKVQFKDVSFLFAGDDIATKLPHPLPFTVLSVPKHGNKYCSPQEWVKAIAPKIAIFSCGNNPWSEPNIDIINEYKSINSLVLRTDKEGAITITSTGNTLQLETMRQQNSLKHTQMLITK